MTDMTTSKSYSELIQARSDGVATLRFNRPDARNAMNPSMRDALMAALGRLAADDTTRAVILRGNGDSFVAGGDLNAFAETLQMDPETRRRNFHERVTVSSTLVEQLIDFPKPLIAVIEGDAAGAGISIALCCDFVIASTNARLSFAHAHVGLALDLGLSYFLPRIAGTLQAKRLAMLGARITAKEAFALGLITTLAEQNSVDAELDELLKSLSRIPVTALAGIKRELRHSDGNNLSAQLSLEADEVAACAKTEAFAERVASFFGR
ncbi:MAG: enoyl-CoA hydratase/isomerase family protein [Pseudomonadales bacterium]